MSRSLLCTALVSLHLLSPVAFSQSQENPIEIFGYFQAAFDHSHERTASSFLGTSVADRNTFVLQQLNLLGTKRFSPLFSCFLGLAFTNNFRSENNWGTFSLDEAWVKYEHSSTFTVKAGLLTPTFNNLHEIKNRTPLLPYIVRPIVYEASAEGLFQAEDFLPEKAFVQIFGFVPIAEAKLDYAVYVGNSESAWFNSTTNLSSTVTLRGADTTTFKLLGARVGARYRQLKAGFSMTVDKDNQVALGLGAVHRLRFGGDFSCQFLGFSVESEFIVVNEQLTDEQQLMLNFISHMNPLVGTSLDKLFYYGNLTYDFSEKFYSYTGYQFANTNVNSASTSKLNVFTLGAGFRPTESVVVKAQFFRLSTKLQPLFEMWHNRYQAAVSVYF